MNNEYDLILKHYFNVFERAKFKYPEKKKSSLKKLSVIQAKKDGAIKSYLINKYSKVSLKSFIFFFFF